MRNTVLMNGTITVSFMVTVRLNKDSFSRKLSIERNRAAPGVCTSTSFLSNPDTPEFLRKLLHFHFMRCFFFLGERSCLGVSTGRTNEENIYTLAAWCCMSLRFGHADWQVAEGCNIKRLNCDSAVDKTFVPFPFTLLISSCHLPFQEATVHC